MGNTESLGLNIAELFASFALNDPEIFLMESDEAEAVKLFSNAYLATRISFFNELDTFALANNLDSQSIHRWRYQRPQNWQSLLQSIFWVWWILFTQRYKTT